jgi:uncharacterized repeat protein (TIGR01451 family)
MLSGVDLNPLDLLPGHLFGRTSSQTRTARRQATSAVGSSSGSPAAPIRTAARPRVGSAVSSPTFDDGFTLPGLGSPASSPPGGSATGPSGAVDDYAIIHPDGSVTVSGINDSGPTLSAVGNQPTASSPDPRTPIKFDSSELRRELVSAYPLGDRPRPAADDVTSLPEPEPAAVVRPRTEPIELSRAARSHIPANTGPQAAAQAFAPKTEQPAAAGRPFRPTPPAQTLSPTTTIELDRAWGQTVVTDSPGPDVLVTNQTPVITSDILGPKQILIGREASYRVRLHNDGDVPADELVADIRIPSWADVVDTTASRGAIQQSQNSRPPGALQWQIQHLDAHASETLNLRLIPRASRPLELGVTWTCAPVGSRAVVEVQEPKLRMHISGPDEVLFDKPQVYRLTLTNPGTGVAQNVKIDLLPPGGGDDSVSTHQLGDLPPGTSQSVEVELTAREAGKLYVKAIASADGGLSSDAAKEIFCRKPELDVDWRGPETKYAGTPATYFFRVRNPGTATADDVSVVVTLPEGMEFATASEGQMFDPQHRSVTWRVGSLGPGDDYYMELKGTLRTPGVNQLRVAATTAAGDLSDSKLAETKVVALADLTLDVSDPPGPVAVGADALYEIRITNRGASAAEDIKVVALFSDGIEPETVEGALYSVTDGRVTFRTIDTLPAGRQIVLRIHAHGTQPGNHVVRAEVFCKDLDIKLAEEETTRFFADEFVEGGADPGQHSASLGAEFDSATR